jgi:molybdopterin converting factor small subunit
LTSTLIRLKSTPLGRGFIGCEEEEKRLSMASIRVTARMMGPLKEASGSEEQELTLTQDAKVSDAIYRILEAHGGALNGLLLDMYTFSPTTNALILLNGVEVGNLQGLSTPLRDGDSLVLLSVTHGG